MKQYESKRPKFQQKNMLMVFLIYMHLKLLLLIYKFLQYWSISNLPFVFIALSPTFSIFVVEKGKYFWQLKVYFLLDFILKKIFYVGDSVTLSVIKLLFQFHIMWHTIIKISTITDKGLRWVFSLKWKLNLLFFLWVASCGLLWIFNKSEAAKITLLYFTCKRIDHSKIQ